MKARTFRIGIIQHASGEDRKANIACAIERIREAAARGAQIICLQELFSAPYFCKAESDERFAWAEPIPGPTTEALQPIAHEHTVVLIVPVFEMQAPGVYYNAAAVLDADGTLCGVYRKMHIPDDPLYYEKFYFTPGSAEGRAGGFQTFTTRYARIGTLICWDQWFPEAARITALSGAEVLFYPTAIGWHPPEKQELGQAQFEAWQISQRAHAIANGLYVAAANRIGHEPEPGTKGLEFFGQSFICDPFGRLIETAPADKPAVLVAECDRQKIAQTRQHWPFLRDRRIDAYGPIVRRWIDDKP